MGASSNAVVSAYVINLVVTLGCILAFSIIRQTALFRKFVAPKRFLKSQVVKPKRPAPGFFSWIPSVWTFNEHDIIEVAGLDSAVYLRIMQFGVECFFYVTLWCLITVLPTNLSGHEMDNLIESDNAPSPPPPRPPSPPLPPPLPSPPDGFPPAPECKTPDSVETKDYKFTDFDRCSISNLPEGSPKFWVHVVAIWFITIVVLKLVARYNREIVILRNIFISHSTKGGPSHTVLLTDIPGVFYGTIGETLQWLAAGTLFRCFPPRIRMKILETIAGWAGAAMDKTSKVNFASALSATRDSEAGSEEGAEGGLDVENGADKPQMHAVVKTPAGVTVSFAEKRRNITYTDLDTEVLDPWKQAESVLKQGRTVHELVALEFDLVYPRGAVAAINVVHDQRSLQALIAKYQKIRTLLEDYLDHCASYVRRRKPVKRKLVTVIGPLAGPWATAKYGTKPVKVDAITFWSESLIEQMKLIEAEQARALETEIPTAFVTFNHRQNQCIAANSLMNHDETAWKVQNAPEHYEVVWSNVKMRSWERSLRGLAMWSLFVLLTLFYLIPISFIQLMIEAPNKWGGFWQNRVVQTLLQAILPGLVLKIFLAILPMILALMCRLAGFVSNSTIDFGVVFRYFIFQFVAVFLGNMLVGSFTNQISAFVNDPAGFFTTLGVAIPKTSTFFITYILISVWSGKSIEFIRIPALVIYSILSRIAATPRARARLWTDQYTTYGKTVVDQTIVILLGLVYAAINPIICPTVFVAFVINSVYERYNNIYVYKREYESGGELWRYVFMHIMVSLYTMQLGFIAMMIIKKFPGFPALIPPLIFTIIFHIRYYLLYNRPWSKLALHDCAELDLMDKEEQGEDDLTYEEKREIKEKYLSPCFKLSFDDIEDLLYEAKVMDRRLNGEKLEDIKEALEYEAFLSASEGEDDDSPPPALASDLPEVSIVADGGPANGVDHSLTNGKSDDIVDHKSVTLILEPTVKGPDANKLDGNDKKMD